MLSALQKSRILFIFTLEFKLLLSQLFSLSVPESQARNTEVTSTEKVQTRITPQYFKQIPPM